MNKILNYLIIITILIISTGCSRTINYNTTVKKIKAVENKNYTINERKTAYVGE